MRSIQTTGCLLVALCSVTSGCGALNDLRAHNIRMTIEAVQSIPRTKGTPITIERETEDALERLAMLQRDFPLPKKHDIERHSAEDEEAYFAYAGLVAKREARRESWNKLTAPLTKTWDIVTWLIKWAWAIAFTVLAVWVYREFFKRDVVHIKQIAATIPDKEKRRQVAEGSPIGKRFDRMKAWLIPSSNGNGQKPPTDAPGATKTTLDGQ